MKLLILSFLSLTFNIFISFSNIAAAQEESEATTKGQQEKILRLKRDMSIFEESEEKGESGTLSKKRRIEEGGNISSFNQLPSSSKPHLGPYRMYVQEDEEGYIFSTFSSNTLPISKIRLYGPTANKSVNHVHMVDPPAPRTTFCSISTNKKKKKGKNKKASTRPKKNKLEAQTSTAYGTNLRTYYYNVKEFQLGHGIDHADTAPGTKSSTHDPENFVPQIQFYNEWIRNPLVQHFRKKAIDYLEISIYHKKNYKYQVGLKNNKEDKQTTALPIPEGFIFIGFDRATQDIAKNAADKFHSYYFPNFAEYEEIVPQKAPQSKEAQYGYFLDLYRVDNINNWFFNPTITLKDPAIQGQQYNKAKQLTIDLQRIAHSFFPSTYNEKSMPSKARAALLGQLFEWSYMNAATLEQVGIENQLNLIFLLGFSNPIPIFDDRSEEMQEKAIRDFLENNKIGEKSKSLIEFHWKQAEKLEQENAQLKDEALGHYKAWYDVMKKLGREHTNYEKASGVNLTWQEKPGELKKSLTSFVETLEIFKNHIEKQLHILKAHLGNQTLPEEDKEVYKENLKHIQERLKWSTEYYNKYIKKDIVQKKKFAFFKESIKEDWEFLQEHREYEEQLCFSSGIKYSNPDFSTQTISEIKNLIGGYDLQNKTLATSLLTNIEKNLELEEDNLSIIEILNLLMLYTDEDKMKDKEKSEKWEERLDKLKKTLTCKDIISIANFYALKNRDYNKQVKWVGYLAQHLDAKKSVDEFTNFAFYCTQKNKSLLQKTEVYTFFDSLYMQLGKKISSYIFYDVRPYVSLPKELLIKEDQVGTTLMMIEWAFKSLMRIQD